MLGSASPARVARCRQYGAEVVMSTTGAVAFALAEKLREEEGRTFVHPFEGPLTALGTATMGLEFHEQAGELDALIVPIGGGGLCAGVASAFKALQPRCRIYGVEPIGADTMHRSFAAGSLAETATTSRRSQTASVHRALPYSYALCRAHVDKLVPIDDDQIVDAMALLFREMKLAVEPAGAAATAALVGPARRAPRTPRRRDRLRRQHRHRDVRAPGRAWRQPVRSTLNQNVGSTPRSSDAQRAHLGVRDAKVPLDASKQQRQNRSVYERERNRAK